MSLLGVEQMNTRVAPISRRTFCRLSLAVAAVTAPSICAQTSAPAPAVRFFKNLSPGHIGVNANQSQAIEYAVACGFEGISPDPGEFQNASNAQIQDWLAKMAQHNIRYGTAGLPVEFRKDNQRFEETIASLPHTARILRDLGVNRMATWILPGDNDLTYLQNFDLHKTRLRRVALILADHGIRFGLEFVGPRTSRARFRFPFICTQRGMLELTRAIGTDNVGLLLDSWHWYTSHGTVDELLTVSNSDIVHVHVNDAPEGIGVDQQQDNRRKLPVTTGVIDAAGFINALAKIGYDGPVECEPFDAELRDLPDPEACKMTAAALDRLWKLIKT